MLSGYCRLESNILKSGPYSSSNSGNKNHELERMNCRKENENTIIYRVWISKRSISLTDEHILHIFSKREYIFLKQKKNIFKIKNKINCNFKHWAIILELSNGTYVNIQFGREGFSLEEFNKTDVEGEAALNAIISTWGEDGHPFSFCYLGFANYEYDKLKRLLKEVKNNEQKSFEEKKSCYYNVLFYNCHHFACDIEKILFGDILFFHFFNFAVETSFIALVTFNAEETEWILVLILVIC